MGWRRQGGADAAVRDDPRVRETLRNLIKQPPVTGASRLYEVFVVAQRCRGAMSSAKRGVLGVVGSAAGGVEVLRTGLVEPAMVRGWQVAVTLTPTAGSGYG